MQNWNGIDGEVPGLRKAGIAGGVSSLYGNPGAARDGLAAAAEIHRSAGSPASGAHHRHGGPQRQRLPDLSGSGRESHAGGGLGHHDAHGGRGCGLINQIAAVDRHNAVGPDTQRAGHHQGPPVDAHGGRAQHCRTVCYGFVEEDA